MTSSKKRKDKLGPLSRAWVTFRRALKALETAQLLLLGYIFYTALGWGLLCLPISQAEPVSALNNLFIASSAVSTTGLVSVDPGTSYTLFGEIIILLLIQMGGLGYMTFGSFIVLSLSHRLSNLREDVVRTAFPLPEDFNIKRFIRRVVIFTLSVEVVGALLLLAFFLHAGVEDPIWAAIFHSVSAFCTAGFSLFSNSFENFTGNAGIVFTISALSYLGAVGFIVMNDAYDRFFGGKKALGFTSKVILSLTLKLSVLGTALLFIVEPSLSDLAPYERLLAAFFQVMTAGTTVGFNTVPIGGIGHATLLVLLILMIFGASPSGTGGGVKLTTLAALLATMRCILTGQSKDHLYGHKLDQLRLRQASATMTFYALVVTVALFALFLTEAGAPFEMVLFEAISAIGTVGLSMGLTGNLSELGKIIVIILMIAGRLGILTFGLAFVAKTKEEDADDDEDLVL